MGHYSDDPKPENGGRMGRFSGRTTETDPESYSPILMNEPAPQNPQPPSPLTEEKVQKPAQTPANPPQKKPKGPKLSPSKPKEKSENTSDSRDDSNAKQSPKEIKEKYSIYLPKKLSMALRMAYIITRDPYSSIVETALTDMLFNRYQCNNGECLVRFSMSETDATPMRCPHCGKTDITPLRIDVLD